MTDDHDGKTWVLQCTTCGKIETLPGTYRAEGLAKRLVARRDLWAAIANLICEARNRKSGEPDGFPWFENVMVRPYVVVDGVEVPVVFFQQHHTHNLEAVEM